MLSPDDLRKHAAQLRLWAGNSTNVAVVAAMHKLASDLDQLAGSSNDNGTRGDRDPAAE